MIRCDYPAIYYKLRLRYTGYSPRELPGALILQLHKPFSIPDSGGPHSSPLFHLFAPALTNPPGRVMLIFIRTRR